MADLLNVVDLDKSFGKQQVLHGVSFSVATGHIVGLVGPNGAGKSTIMKSILGLIPTDGGKITIADDPVSITSHQELDQVGALIEYPGIYPFLTGKQHLQLFANHKNRQANIEQVVNALGMQRYINQRAKQYSLGMKQKLGIAQALVNHPRLVILDEPMNGLDPQAVKNLRDYIRQLADEGTSFLISSHILSELEKLADDILILDHGQIVRQSSMNELVQSGGTSYIIRTNKDTQAKEVLTNAGINLLPNQAIMIAQERLNSLDEVLRLLIAANISIVDVNKVQHDLEESFLDMVNADKEAK
ncbi:ABC transporter-like protein [Lapidilactobacillus dextrinicus DSM 20335]|uniref:ABC transporter-like protein n=1 Tax=Lapidilactobacillus dextrinicus DSM 20335 TaxID=1423738 RepID=A0A0R2BU01_9LACO|nr:ATP-binding cassette domain-containing protein [Lapidilactobacillus dextrinicus]KRM79849.1 ABC transporter-like protein [Lapidilactobacillus dextrinicus DSM 20335]QFG46366.1 ATP-binding cassette domain-containing protein [Lapidilactobacillus dextrinicus]